MESKSILNPCIFMFGIIVLSSHLPAYAKEAELTRDNAAKPIVFLVGPVADKMIYQGKEHEIWLRNPDTNDFIPKTHMEAGTGFIVKYQDETYLVTAKHIAQNTSISWSATISGPNDLAVSFSFPEFTGFTNNLPWVEHPVADVAVLRLKDDSKFSISSMMSRFDIEIFVSEPKAPSREKILTLLGFPLALGVQQKISPLAKESKAASGLYEINGTTVFFLSDPGIQGYSGSPVFAFPIEIGSVRVGSRRTYCYGLISATLSDSTGGKLAQVVPSSQIRETIFRAHEQDKNKKDEGKGK